MGLNTRCLLKLLRKHGGVRFWLNKKYYIVYHKRKLYSNMPSEIATERTIKLALRKIRQREGVYG